MRRPVISVRSIIRSPLYRAREKERVLLERNSFANMQQQLSQVENSRMRHEFEDKLSEVARGTIAVEAHERKIRELEQRFFTETKQLLERYEQDTRDQLRAMEERKNQEFAGTIQQLREGVA